MSRHLIFCSCSSSGKLFSLGCPTHRTYDAQRYSPLDRINKANVKDLKLAYAGFPLPGDEVLNRPRAPPLTFQLPTRPSKAVGFAG
jgi:hypothetical protein